MFEAARRFSCVFLTTSGEGAARLNHQLSQAGIRAYHAVDTREAEVLLALTRAKVLLIDIDRTFELLDKACDERYGYLTYLNVEPLFDSVRSEPRFVELVRRVGLV